ncbi:ABC transporter substrate-binding protein [Lysinibacter cavernae]|uniref:Multiple sugar transport system substrate-binding protein n=1 Tax=Lysinibacter cavernae TaxID=1640652 RepID=A0A7X5R4D3_9MICO|nr:sugar ABC transporter substrate-binding protein [Lysinibacter cavernae]NIH55157.1 multiple sugar transport system substrate-binding protein [Lysinibacter cavernae]
MRTTKFGIAGIALTAALALTACAGGEPDNGTVKLQMVESLTNPARTDVIRGLLDDFEAENPGITVELVSPPTDQADQKIQQMLQSGTGIDVLEVRDITVGPFSTNGWLYDMTDDLQGWSGWDDLTDNAISQTTYAEDGKTYSIPYGFYGLSLFYRTDLVEEAGFDAAPTSWDDLLEQASAIQDPEKNRFGYAFRGGSNANSNVVAIITSYAADKINVDNAFELTGGGTVFSTPEAAAAVKTYFEIFKKASPPSSVAWGYPEMVEGFSNGSTAFLLQDPEVIAAIQQSSSLTEEQWSTAPLLVGASGKAAQPVSSGGWGIAKATKHPEESLKLIKFLSEGDAPITFAKENSLVPILKSAADDEFYKVGAWESYLYMTEHPDVYIPVTQPRTVSWWTEWAQKADTEIQQVLIGKMTEAEMLASWDQYWTEKWATK